MTRSHLDLALSLLTSAIAEVNSDGKSARSVSMGLHGCTDEDLAVAESAGGTRLHFSNDASCQWDAVHLSIGPRSEVMLWMYGQHRPVDVPAETPPEALAVAATDDSGEAG